MNTEILIKYISKQATLQECEQVMDWVNQNEENKKVLMMLINMEALLLSEDKACRASAEEYNSFIMQCEEVYNVGKKQIRNLWWRNSKIKRYIGYAAVILFVFSVSLNILQFSIKAPVKIEAQPLICGTRTADALHREIFVAKGEKSRVELPDGSVVWLNSESRITFPLKFSAHARMVTLLGEGYFEVVENPNQPMIVNLDNDYSLKVLGTTFNVKSYKNENAIETTLYSGKIDVYEKGKDTPIHSMTPNETYIIRPAVSIIQQPESVINVSAEIMEKIAAWKDGVLYFDNLPIRDVVVRLERWYGIEVRIDEEILSDYTYTAKFENTPIVNVLEDMRDKLPVDYRIEENVIYLVR